MKKKMLRSFMLLLLIGILVSLAACGQDAPNEESQETSDSQTEPSSDEAPQQEPGRNTMTLDVYYADDQLLELNVESREVTYETEEDLLKGIWTALQQPENEGNQSLWSKTTLNRIAIEDGTLLFDIDNSDEVHLGSSGEAFAIQVILNTYGQLDQIDAVQFLINGEVIETLYGHITIDEPFPVDTELMEF